MNIYKQKQTNLFSSLSIPLDVICLNFCSGRMLCLKSLALR